MGSDGGGGGQGDVMPSAPPSSQLHLSLRQWEHALLIDSREGGMEGRRQGEREEGREDA